MLSSEQDIVGLDVTMHYTVIVRVPERTEDIAKNLYDLLYRQLSRTSKSRSQRFAFDERHCVVRESVTDPRRKDWDYVRMLELRGELYLTAKSLDVDRGGEVGRQHFYDHLSAERSLLGDENA
jgi:hypothetical protein